MYYERDLNNAAILKRNAIRLSIEWSRIQPDRNQWNQEDVEHYKKMIILKNEKRLSQL